MSSLSAFEGTSWTGTAELWLDPLGDEGVSSDCTISIEKDRVRYTWSHEGKSHQGSGAAELFQVAGSYGPGSEWGWRTGLSFRAPTGELVLQMTNIAPWGEEARAVRMICQQNS